MDESSVFAMKAVFLEKKARDSNIFLIFANVPEILSEKPSAGFYINKHSDQYSPFECFLRERVKRKP